MDTLELRFQRISEQAKTRSRDSITALLDFLKLHPEHAKRSFPVLFSYLDQDLLPPQLDPDYFRYLPRVVTSALAFTGLVMLATTFPHLKSEISGEGWPLFCTWTFVFVKSALLMPPQTGSKLREEVVRAVYDAQRASSFPGVTNRGDIAEPLLVFWLGAGKDRSLQRTMDRVNPRWAESVKASLVVWFCSQELAYGQAEQISTRMAVVGGAPLSVYVEGAVNHLLSDARQFKRQHPEADPKNPGQHLASLLILVVARTVALKQSTNVLAPFYLDLVPVIGSALQYLQRFSPKASVAHVVQKGLSACFVIVEDLSKDTLGHKHVANLIRRGLLQALAGLRFWITVDNPVPLDKNNDSFRRVAVNLERLTSFLTYREVAYNAASVFLKHGDTPDFVQMRQTDAWNKMEKQTLKQAKLIRREHCRNKACSDNTEDAVLFVCHGCDDAMYCSRMCQRYDWKHGGHREACMKIQNALLDGNLVEKERDRAYIQALAQATLNAQKNNVANVIEFARADKPTGVVLQLEFNGIRPSFTATGSYAISGCEVKVSPHAPLARDEYHVNVSLQAGTTTREAGLIIQWSDSDGVLAMHGSCA